MRDYVTAEERISASPLYLVKMTGDKKVDKSYIAAWLKERIQHYEGVNFDVTSKAFERGLEIGEVRGLLDAFYQMQELLRG